MLGAEQRTDLQGGGGTAYDLQNLRPIRPCWVHGDAHASAPAESLDDWFTHRASPGRKGGRPKKKHSGNKHTFIWNAAFGVAYFVFRRQETSRSGGKNKSRMSGNVG